MENELTCCVCLELYSHPLMLPCLHNFCRKCLEDLYRHSATAPSDADVEPERRRRSARLRLLSCPKCRREATLDTWKGISTLPENKALENIVSVYASYTNNPDVFPKCRVHEEKMMCHYCLTCKKSLCERCASEQHSGFSHHVELLQDLIAKEEDTLNTYVREFDAVGNRIKLHQDEVSDLLSDLEAKKMLSHSLVKEHMSVISSCLHVQKMKLSGEVDDGSLTLSKPLTALREKYTSLHSELLILKDCRKEVLKEKNLAWKLKRLQDLSLRCSTFLTFRTGNIPVPPEEVSCSGHLGDVDVKAVLSAIGQLHFSRRNRRKVFSVQSVSTQTDDFKMENCSEKDDNMNVGDRNRRVPANNAPDCGPTSNVIQGHTKTDSPDPSLECTGSDNQLKLEKDHTTIDDQGEVDMEALLGAVGGPSNSTEVRAKPTTRSPTLDIYTDPFEETQANLKHLALDSEPREARKEGRTSRGASPSESKRSIDVPSTGAKYVFGSAQNSSWPTSLSRGKFLFSLDTAGVAANSSGKDDRTPLPHSTDETKQKSRSKKDKELCSHTHGSWPSFPLPDTNGRRQDQSTALSKSDKDKGKRNRIKKERGHHENHGSWPNFPAANSSGPSIQRASSEPSANVVSSSGQFCGIGARFKTRHSHSPPNSTEDKKMGAALKEGFSSAIGTLRSLCGVGMNGSSVDTPSRSNLVWSTGDLSHAPRVWPSTSTSDTNREQTKSKQLTATPLNNTPLVNCSFGKALSETKLGPIDNDLFKKKPSLASCAVDSPVAFRSLNGNSVSDPKYPPKKGLKSNAKSSGLRGGAFSFDGARSMPSTSSGFLFCDNSTQKPAEHSGSGPESDPETFTTPEEAFNSFSSAPTFHMGVSSPLARPKINNKRHVKKRR